MLKVPCEIYARPCGFYSIVSHGFEPKWNKGKTEEFRVRKPFTEQSCLNTKTNTFNPDEKRIELYTLPNCEKCEQVKSALSQAGITVTIKDNLRDVYKTQREAINSVRMEDGTIPMPVVFTVTLGRQELIDIRSFSNEEIVQEIRQFIG